jgi:TolB protein
MRLALALLFASVPLRAADVYMKVAGQGGQPAITLGLPAFMAEDPTKGADAVLAQQVRDVVRADLLQSRYFDLKDVLPVGSTNEEWKKTGASWLLTLKLSQAADKAVASAKLVNLDSGETAFERYYRQDPRFIRSLAHKVSDDVVQATTGKRGVAQTQIAFAVSKSGRKEIWLADYDGANPKQVTRDGSINLLPRFSPDRKKLAFTSYKDGNPDLFIIELGTGKTEAISSEQGLNIAGGFSPDGTQLLMTLSRQKSPNLYLKAFADGSVTQLTQHFGADSSPTFSPDSNQVAFVSDRTGNPQIFILDLNTRRAKRLTNLNWCDSPSWSPTGEWIAFAGRAHVKDKLDIYIVDVTGSQIRQLTHGEGANENPSWAPDGRSLTFTSTRNGKAELFVMDADGSTPRRLLEVAGAAMTPNWSN